MLVILNGKYKEATLLNLLLETPATPGVGGGGGGGSGGSGLGPAISFDEKNRGRYNPVIKKITRNSFKHSITLQANIERCNITKVTANVKLSSKCRLTARNTFDDDLDIIFGAL